MKYLRKIADAYRSAKAGVLTAYGWTRFQVWDAYVSVYCLGLQIKAIWQGLFKAVVILMIVGLLTAAVLG